MPAKSRAWQRPIARRRRFRLPSSMSRLLSVLSSLVLGLAVVGAARAQTDPCQTNADVWAGQGFSNAISVYSLEWRPFGVTEWGWETYLPLIQHELRTECGPGTPIFA